MNLSRAQRIKNGGRLNPGFCLSAVGWPAQSLRGKAIKKTLGRTSGPRSWDRRLSLRSVVAPQGFFNYVARISLEKAYLVSSRYIPVAQKITYISKKNPLLLMIRLVEKVYQRPPAKSVVASRISWTKSFPSNNRSHSLWLQKKVKQAIQHFSIFLFGWFIEEFFVRRLTSNSKIRIATTSGSLITLPLPRQHITPIYFLVFSYSINKIYAPIFSKWPTFLRRKRTGPQCNGNCSSGLQKCWSNFL